MMESRFRGGVCMISKRHSVANNKHLGPARYDATKPSTYIMYLDANNLYGWAMSQPMPYGFFRWLSEEEIRAIEWTDLDDDSLVGYFVECDLDYPAELHEEHNDYPLAPERMDIDFTMLSDTAVEIRRHYDMSNNVHATKLVPNLLNKRHYVVHYRLLKFYLQHGLHLVKVHRAIGFMQRPWLETYITLNQNLRAGAQNDFEKDFFKLMNNAVYGKTCENQKKRTDIKLVTTDRKRRRLTEKPHCLGFRIFSEGLAAVELRKIKLLINKPFYVGFSVLELSKLHMYKFHYDHIKRRFGNRAQLLFTDTDSLMYEIEARDIYENLWEDSDLFDFSNYKPTSPYFDNKNNKVIGKFKDEAAGNPIVEFVGLRPKMYSFLVLDSATQELKGKHRAKGIQYAAANHLRHEDYLA